MTEYRQAQVATGPQFAPFKGHKRRIAVLPFENRADKGGEKLGERVADMLVTQLLKSDRFSMMERQEIENILGEQAFGQSGAITDETALEAGQMLGVEALVIGTITEFDQKSGSESIGSDEKKWRFTLQATVATANIAFRLINTSTGEILFADHAQQSEIRPGFGIKTEEYDFNDLFQIDQTLIGTALRGAVNKIAVSIADRCTAIRWKGKIIRVAADFIYFTPGKNAGVALNEVFAVFHPANASEYDEENASNDDRFETHQVAKIKVVSFIGEKVCKAILLEGEDIEVGDIVEEIKSSD
ncbi:hypothetical protein JXJ21_04890 [candidate division KSB1 bacterium]|nr:hypothetical protein [candidate division KSB1 bacterium]